MEATPGQVVLIADGERQYFAWLEGQGGGGIVFASPEGEVSSDGHIGLVRFSGGVLAGYALRSGKSLQVGGQPIFTSTEPVDVSMEIGPTLVEGFLRGPLASFGRSLHSSAVAGWLTQRACLGPRALLTRAEARGSPPRSWNPCLLSALVRTVGW